MAIALLNIIIILIAISLAKKIKGEEIEYNLNFFVILFMLLAIMYLIEFLLI